MVSLVKTTPELSKDALYLREQRPNNLLRWDLEIEPAMNGEKALAINYEFRLELDKQMIINVGQNPAVNPESGFGGLPGAGFGGGGFGGGLGSGKGGKGGTQVAAVALLAAEKAAVSGRNAVLANLEQA